MFSLEQKLCINWYFLRQKRRAEDCSDIEIRRTCVTQGLLNFHLVQTLIDLRQLTGAETSKVLFGSTVQLCSTCPQKYVTCKGTFPRTSRLITC